MKEIIEKYELKESDFWTLTKKGQKLNIIKHQAVRKIAKKESIGLEMPIIKATPLHNGALHVYCMQEISLKENTVVAIGESWGSYKSGNVGDLHPTVMAVKRAQDRAVIQILELPFYSDMEAEEFKKDNNTPKGKITNVKES